MIARDQAEQIMKLTDEMIAVSSDEDLAPSYEVRDRLRAFVDALVMPEPYDAEALRDRVHEINRSSGRLTRANYTTDQEQANTLKGPTHERTD